MPEFAEIFAEEPVEALKLLSTAALHAQERILAARGAQTQGDPEG